MSFSDPLPGVVHDYSSGNSQRWITNIPRYSAVRLAGMYPGIDVVYTLAANGDLVLRVLLAPNADLRQVVLEIPEAVALSVTANGGIRARLGVPRDSPTLSYDPTDSSDPVNLEPMGNTTFRINAPGRSTGSPVRVELRFRDSASRFANIIRTFQSDLWSARTVADPAGRPDPFPAVSGTGCGYVMVSPKECTDVGVYRFSPAGEILSVTYLSGNFDESPAFLGVAKDSTVVVTGTTNSPDFPVSTNAYQRAYAGPAAEPTTNPKNSGDYFAVRLDPTTGALRAATYLGGPNADSTGETVLASDGSVYFLHKFGNTDSTGLPTSPGSLMRQCAEPGVAPFPHECLNGYAAQLSANLDRLVFGTYVPGAQLATMRLHSDGSVYYSGRNAPSFQPTPRAYQAAINGPSDAVVARLDSAGSTLLFATYLGGPKSDSAFSNAVAADGSIWVETWSFDRCCVDIESRLIRLDANGEKKLVDLPVHIADVSIDSQGDVLAMTTTPFPPSRDALVSNPCPGNRLAYVRISPMGEVRFFTYLPRTSSYEFQGTGPNGLPILILDGAERNNMRFEIVEGQNMGVFAGCMVDAASYLTGDIAVPGGIVTIFGSQMGPVEGAVFSIENGRLPTILGGSQVLVNNQPIPLLYVSNSQINAILPFDLQPGGPFEVVVRTANLPVNSSRLPSSGIVPAAPTLFSADGSGGGQVAAINEDGTVNSPLHPARPGSIVMLFGTGGGQTDPASNAGDVTPLALRTLVNVSGIAAGASPLRLEFAGAAPGLVSGVNQFNVRLPDPMPRLSGYPSGTLPISPYNFSAGRYLGTLTIAVTGN